MKKVSLLLMVGLFLLSGFVFAQDFDGTKIYINPGHGGNDPANDRFIPETGFWESESNLTKGLYLRDLLENLNAQVFMSRTQNRDEDDLPLSQISADANANNVDLFESIHSNAFNATTNYSLLLYKEVNGQPADPQSKILGDIMVDEIYRVHRTTGKYNRGDYSFLGFNLGVLRNLNYNIMRGVLSEGSFHDYLPESWRLMNMDYRKHESIAILRSFLKFYNMGGLPHGIIAGLIRAKDKQVEYAYNYNSALPNDRKLALNNVKVTLLPSQRVYITDDRNNGFYMFDSLAPGNYTLIVESGEYQTDTLYATVQANRTVFADAFLVENPDKAPYVFSHKPANAAVNVNTYSDIEINFSRTMDPPSVEAAFSIAPPVSGTFTWSKENQVVHFRPRDAYQLDTDYEVNLSTAALSQFGVPLEEALQLSFHTSTNHVRPKILTHYPTANMDSVFTHSSIEITFDAEMRPETIDNAFLLEPYVPGSFEWLNDNKKVIFKPKYPLQAQTYYTVNVTQNVKNYYGISPESDYAYGFKTRKINRVEVLRTFPYDQAKEVSQKMWVYISLDRFVDPATVTNQYFQVESEFGKIHPVRYLEITDSDLGSLITFKPQPDLETNRNYLLTIFPGIATPEGLMMQDTLRIAFLTQNTLYESGLTLDGFENLDNWLQPLDGPYSAGIDSQGTQLLRSSVRKISGNYRAELRYAFSGSSGGLVHVYNPGRISLGSNELSEFGLWVFGDYSLNHLELWFDHDAQTNYPVEIGALNWYGWKLIRFPMNFWGRMGELFIHSIVIRQNPEGIRSSTIYFDDLQMDVTVGMEDCPADVPAGPDRFHLYQNYPNPFNPLTVISYKLPAVSDVELSIYNILGQKVATLVSERQAPGDYAVAWDASGFPSGVYVCRLSTASGFTQTKKLILLK